MVCVICIYVVCVYVVCVHMCLWVSLVMCMCSMEHVYLCVYICGMFGYMWWLCVTCHVDMCSAWCVSCICVVSVGSSCGFVCGVCVMCGVYHVYGMNI
jgi:hypothetical protein